MSADKGEWGPGFKELFEPLEKAQAERKRKAGVHKHIWEDIGSFGPVNRKPTLVVQECKVCGDSRKKPRK